MAVVAPVFFDTTVLLAGLIELGDVSRYAQKALAAVAERRLSNPHTAWHCCLEFFAVSTRLPAEMRLDPHDALLLIEREILGRFQVHQLPERARKGFLVTAEHDRVVGGRLYDAHIAEIARIAGAKSVVTDNRRHYATLLRHGIRVLSTEEFTQSL